MTDLLDDWYRTARSRRCASLRGARLAPSLLGDAEANAENSVAAARAVLESLARRPIRLGLDRGGSRANLVTGEVNLDGCVLEAEEAPWTDRVERFLGLAAHEASHFLWTPTDCAPRDRLFRTIQNVLEDERIEGRLARRHPELIHPLYVTRRDLLTAGTPDSPFLSAFFTLVRCEEPIDPRLWARYEARLCAVIEALTPFPRTFAEVRFASLAIVLQVPPDEYELIPALDLSPWPSGLLEDEDGYDEDEAAELRRHRRLPGAAAASRGRTSKGRSGAWPPVVWSRAEDARADYARVRGEVAARAGALADRLRSLLPAPRIGRQTSGRIDRKRLHASGYSPRIFRSPGSQPPTLSIAILIDQSGSMEGRSARVAQQVGVLVSEAARMLTEVRLAVFGHHADLGGDASTHMVRYPLDGERRPLGLGRLPIRGNNRDAHALRTLGAELLGSPLAASRYRIAIVIADGAPSARRFNGQEAILQTRDAIVWLDRMWGPVLFVATDDVERLREMVPGASFRFRSGDAVEELSHHLTLTLMRSMRGSR
jgi:hypothetical protein